MLVWRTDETDTTLDPKDQPVSCARCTAEGCACGGRSLTDIEEPTQNLPTPTGGAAFSHERYSPLDLGTFTIALPPPAWQQLIEGGIVWLSLEFADGRVLRLKLEPEGTLR